jgi:predicted ArsR family transcriptional regulator
MLDHGPSTVAELSERLEITAPAVRRHLDTLESVGHISTRERVVPGRRPRGRPAREYLLTDLGRDQFEHAYDDLALKALRFLRETAGPDAVRDFARQRLAALVAGFEAADAGATDAPETLARLLTEQGYATTVEASPIAGKQLCQHHCPVAHVATEFPELCDVEAEVFSTLLGARVQRLATIAGGHAVCTTHISPQTVPAPEAPVTTPSRHHHSERTAP